MLKFLTILTVGFEGDRAQQAALGTHGAGCETRQRSLYRAIRFAAAIAAITPDVVRSGWPWRDP